MGEGAAPTDGIGPNRAAAKVLHAINDPALTEPLPPEHPRPDFRRSDWIALDGVWEFAFDPRNVGERQQWFRSGATAFHTRIVVPFPWESRASGLGAVDYRGVGWYRRSVTIPAEWAERGLRPTLCFGAVDWNAKVWVNGRFALEHDGGYTPFAVDLTPFLRPEETAEVVVRALDLTAADTPLGKQMDNWYTPSSGIWQPVWLEGRGAVRIERVHFTPRLDPPSVGVRFDVAAPHAQEVVVVFRSPVGAFAETRLPLSLAPGNTSATCDLVVPEGRYWSPDDPHLYDVVAEVRSPDDGLLDRVHTYFGLREVRCARWEGRPYEYLLLNGEPIYLCGVLDQGFHPETLHAYASDAAVRADVAAIRSLGFNMVRCHIKTNDPRYYAWADRLGLLVWSDLPCTAIDTPRARAYWERNLAATIRRDYNHPSIFGWVLFNETWGLTQHHTPAGRAWVRDMVALAQSLDPTRPVEDNSPCHYDHVFTDLNSWHFYLGDWRRAREHIERVVEQTYPGSEFNFVGGEWRQGTQPLLNSEYGGLAAAMGDQEIASSFKFLTNELRRHEKICGFVYTEFTDVEWEHNGWLNYDRTPKEAGYDAFVAGMQVRDLLAPDYVGFDAPPCQTVRPEEAVRLGLFFAHYGRRPIERATLRWQVDLVDRLGRKHEAVASGSFEFAPRRYGVLTLPPIELELPPVGGLVTVIARVEAGEAPVARNYVHLEVSDGPAPRCERTGNGWILRQRPGAFVATSWPQPRGIGAGEKFAAGGAGWVEYAFPLPDDLDLERLRQLRVRAEVGAATARRRGDPRFRQLPTDYPQTDVDRKFPTEVTVTINGTPIGRVTIPDDPADARGVLSHHRGGPDPGSYGFLTDWVAPAGSLPGLAPGAVARVRFEVAQDAEAVGGLSLYGEGMGAYPVDLCLLLEEE